MGKVVNFTGITKLDLPADRMLEAATGQIAGQPFWFYAAISAEQWGVTFVCVLYTFAWAKGVWMHWLKPKPSL